MVITFWIFFLAVFFKLKFFEQKRIQYVFYSFLKFLFQIHNVVDRVIIYFSIVYIYAIITIISIEIYNNFVTFFRHFIYLANELRSNYIKNFNLL